MIKLGDRLQDMFQCLLGRNRVDASESSPGMVAPMVIDLAHASLERRVTDHLVSLSDYDFEAAIRRGKVALLAKAIGLNSRVLIKQSRQLRADLAEVLYGAVRAGRHV